MFLFLVEDSQRFGMNSHTLAELLLSMPPKPVIASVDISTCDEDSGRRVFGELIDLNDKHSEEAVLLFEGSLND